MTLYLSFRSQSVGGSVTDPTVLRGNGDVAVPELTEVRPDQIGGLVANKNVLFGVHGFNVSREDGVRAMARLEPSLVLTSSDVFFGVLWPGDFWLPAINYPFEGEVAMDCGRRLARLCQSSFAVAHSISFVSHSLGARLVLEAVTHLDRPARSVCLTAAAIDRDCLEREYASAVSNAEVISVLASRRDRVLQLAYPIGDFFAELFQDDATSLRSALGYNGPPRPVGATVLPSQIPKSADYDHGDYLPPSEPVPPSAPSPSWHAAADFMRRAFRRENQTWP